MARRLPDLIVISLPLLKSLFLFLLAYFIGSIPFGYLIVKAKAGADIRKTGSGGTGATNVSRRAGKAAGLLTLILDATKGAAAVILARILSPDDGLTLIIGLAAVAALIGHIFPVWLGFRGGKGVATAVGVFLVLDPLVVAAAGVLFLAIFFLTRYVSLASVVASLFVPVFVWLQMETAQAPGHAPVLLIISLAASALIVLAHRSNIARLLRGTEAKFR